MSAETAAGKITFAERGPVGKGFMIIWKPVKYLSMSLLLSLILEFVIIKYVHPEQGSTRSAELLEREIGYLSDNFKSQVFYDDTSAVLAIHLSNYIYSTIYVASGFKSFHERYSAPAYASDGTTVQHLKNIYKSVRPYAMATINIVQLFFVRILVILMSLPVFILIAYVAIVDGLVQRDLRRYHGAIERAWLHHYTKSWLDIRMVALPSILYLALPVNVPPSLFFMPSFLFFGLMIFILITTYKKFM